MKKIYREEDYEDAEDADISLDTVGSARENIQEDFIAAPPVVQQPGRTPAIGEPPMQTHEQLDVSHAPVYEENERESKWKQELEDKYPDAEIEKEDAGWWQDTKDLAKEQYHNLVDYEKDQEENWALKSIRYGANAAMGYINKYPAVYIPNIAKMMIEGASDLIMNEMAQNDPDLAYEVAKKASKDWIDYIPDQKWIEDVIENNTGIPLRPKNQLQELLRVGSISAGVKDGTWLSKVGYGTATATLSKAMRELEMEGDKADMVALIGTSLPTLAVSLAKTFFGNQKAAKFADVLMSKDVPDVPPGAPPGAPSTYLQTAESAVGELVAQNATPANTARLTAPLAQTRGQRAPSLQGRATINAADVGFRPTANTPAALQDQIQHTFSPQRFRNKSEAGVAHATEIRRQDDLVYRAVNDSYRESRALNSAIEELRPELQTFINTEMQMLGQPVPGSAQATYLNDLRQLLPELENPISNQALIDKIQQWNKRRDFSFDHGDSMNIYGRLAEAASDSVESAAGIANPAASQSWREARQQYATWANTFNNKYVRPFRNTRTHDYEKLGKDLLSTDKFNQISHALESSPRGQQLLSADRAAIAENKLGKFAKNPRKIDARTYEQSLNDLQAVSGVTPDNIDALRRSFRNAQGNPNFRASYERATAPTGTQNSAAKYMRDHPSGSGEKIPWKGEQIQNMMSDASGIRTIREELSRTNAGKQIYKDLARHEVRDMALEGGLSKQFTGNDMHKLLNNRKNFEKFSEIFGAEETEAARVAAKQLGEQYMRKETILNMGKNVAALKFLKDFKDVIP